MRSPSWLSACSKIPSLALHILRGLWIVYYRLPRLTTQQQQATVVAWSDQLVQHIGIDIVHKGQALIDEPCMMVANHISWLDIEILHASVYCRFVAKSEIASWPLIGTLASAAQTIYIQRGNRAHALDIVKQLTKALQQKDMPPIAVFPEGTTSDGTGLLPFQRRLFQAAIEAQCWVQPIAITYLDKERRSLSTASAYTGNDSLLESVWRTLRSRPLLALVEFCPPLQASAFSDSRELALASQKAVAEARLQHLNS